MNSIVFVDSEIRIDNGAVADLGAVKENAQFHAANKQSLSDFVKSSDFVCGHTSMERQRK